MPLIKAQCTNCNAVLEVDRDKDAAICPNCGTAYIIEKAIHNYNISYAEREDDLAEYLQNGITLLRLKDYAKAKKVFDEMTAKHAGDRRGWLGLSLASNEDRSAKLPYGDNIRELAPREVRKMLGDMLVYDEEQLGKTLSEYDPIDIVEKKLERLDNSYVKASTFRHKESVFTVIWWSIAALISLFGAYKLVKGDIIIGLIVFIIPFAATYILREVLSSIRKIFPQNESVRIDEGVYMNMHENLRNELDKARERSLFAQKVRSNGKPLKYYIDILEM